MDTRKLRGCFPLIIAGVIVILSAVGLVRRCQDRVSTLVADFHRPGGDTLAVAIEMSPLTYSLANDTADGLDYRIISAIAREHDVPVSFYPVANLEKAYQELYDGEYDLLVATMPATNRLKRYFPLTDAVYFDRQVLVQRRDSTGHGRISSQEQLRGDTVYLAEGSPYQTRLYNMGYELGDTIYIESLHNYTSELLAIAVATGRIRQSIVNEAVARRIADDYSNLDVSTPVSFTQFQVWATAPGDSVLTDSINSWLKQFKQTAAYSELIQKYL